MNKRLEKLANEYAMKRELPSCCNIRARKAYFAGYQQGVKDVAEQVKEFKSILDEIKALTQENE